MEIQWGKAKLTLSEPNAREDCLKLRAICEYLTKMLVMI